MAGSWFAYLGGVPDFSVQQRRRRMAVRHGLTPTDRFSNCEEVARSVVGIHATDPASVYLGAWARLDGFSLEDMENELYELRSLVRVLGMRRTMFVVPVDTLPLLDVGCARSLGERERKRTEKMLADGGVTTDPARWLRDAEEAVMAALAEQGPLVATELTKAVPALGEKIAVGQGKKWAGQIGMSTRVLFLLATEGHIIRTRPRGSWRSSQYRWDRMDSWVEGYDPGISEVDARDELVRRYLGRFGPATETDVVWWTGWTKKAARRAIKEVGAESVRIGDDLGYVLPGDDGVDEPGERWVALLPGLDSTIMGWKERDWFLGPHAPDLFDRNGNAGPTVWVDGAVVGTWAQDSEGEVIVRMVEEVDLEANEMIGERAEALTKWLDGTVVKVRFPSPLHRELAQSS